MKVIISTAIWGDAYCSIFSRFSLATLLSPGNIPELAKRATITCHLVTRRVDQRQLMQQPAFAELRRFCSIEWELLEDYGLFEPPEGAGGEKYPFLSALQNIAIRRSIEHDAIVFNYADFIWADGSLTRAVDMLSLEKNPIDAVFGFCLPVDRDEAILALEAHRKPSKPEVIELDPRQGAKIAHDCIHREAKVRFWDEAERLTNLPSYLIWRVGDQGLLLRAYHQSVLAMRVRKDDPEFARGIVRGGLDSSFAGQLAVRKSLAFATCSDQLLVFSLYHTIVDSRVPPGVTREMSLAELLSSNVIPEQRYFAEHPIFLRLRDGDRSEWDRAIDKSQALLKRMQDATPFDQAAYDKNYETHGVVPRISRYRRPTRLALSHLERRDSWPAVKARIVAVQRTGARLRWIGSTLSRPSALKAEVHRALSRSWIWRNRQRIGLVLSHPSMLRTAVERRLGRAQAWRRLMRIWFVLRHPPMLRAAVNRRLSGRSGAGLSPGIVVQDADVARFAEAISVEHVIGKGQSDNSMSELRRAEELLRQAIKSAPAWMAATQALGRNLWFQGRHSEAIATFARGESLRDDNARAASLPVNTCVFLPRNCTESIGLMGHIDGFVKHKILTGDPRPYYLIAPTEGVNPPFLEYWKDYITVVSKPEDIERLAPLEAVYGVNWNWVLPDGDKIVFVHEGIAAAQRAWRQAGRAPLLTVRHDHVNALSRLRTKWGMKEEDRFVCLHVRSAGFYQSAHDNAHLFRNTPIESYYPLMRELAQKGLWVIRMGDASMPPLDLTQCGGKTVDYALSSEKSAELDVALCAQCELFVSSPSGLHTVAHAFGRPVCNVNYQLIPGYPWHPDEIVTPQLYFSKRKGRALTLSEIFDSDLIYSDQQFHFERHGLSLVANSSEDIIETVREALSPSTYSVACAEAADRTCAAFDELNRRYGRGISGRLGRYFAMTYAAQLAPSDDGRAAADAIDEQAPLQHQPVPLQDQVVSLARAPRRKLDFLLAVFDRPRYLHHILTTGLAQNIPGAYFVVFDDASTLVEDVPGLGPMTTEAVCKSFADDRVIYVRNPTNMGVTKTLERYYREVCDAEYTSLLNPKDEFISGAPITNAIAKLDADPKISFVIYPLRQIDRVESDRPLLFKYDRMSGQEFVACHVRDEMLQHCGAYSVLRVSAARRLGIPRNLNLRDFGLEDASGFDHDMIFMMATTGDVEFESEPPLRRGIVDGYTERYPLTFAYCQYQYARRLMAELEPRGFVSAETRRLYLSLWHLIIARGLVVAFQPVHGSERERGVSRIRPHIYAPILLYLPLECLRFRVFPRWEAVLVYARGAKLLLSDWWKNMKARLRIS
jgi:putative glycosyltransferase (TIGR04372 family)